MKVIKDWMAERVVQLLGIEDEVVVEYAIGMLEEPVRHIPPPPHQPRPIAKKGKTLAISVCDL